MKKKSFEELKELFARSGAKDPEMWAKSEAHGERQLARFLFLRQAWKYVVSEDSDSWIDFSIKSAKKHPKGPNAGLGISLEKALEEGVSKEDLTQIVRGMQFELLSQICYMLEDPGDLEEEVEHIRWGLFQLNEKGVPFFHMAGLHESVLSTDPTGREMRPMK